jgi:hypothetical protein
VNHKRTLIGLGVVAAIVVGLAFKFQESQGQQKQTALQSPSLAIPEFEVYRQLFHHHVTMKQKADELEKEGKDAKFLREFYKRRAKLSDDEATAFDDIASDCERRVAQQDAKAKAIRDAALAENGNGKLSTKDARPADPPAELHTLWDERNAIIMRAKYALQAAFGDTEFARFENYLKQDVVPHFSTPPPNSPPATFLGPRHGPKISKYPPTLPEQK